MRVAIILTTPTRRYSAILEPRRGVGRGGDDIKIAVVVDMGVIECCSEGDLEGLCFRVLGSKNWV